MHPDLWIVSVFTNFYERELPRAVLTTVPDFSALIAAIEPGDTVEVQRWTWADDTTGYSMIESHAQHHPLPVSLADSMPGGLQGFIGHGSELPSETTSGYVRGEDGVVRRTS